MKKDEKNNIIKESYNLTKPERLHYELNAISQKKVLDSKSEGELSKFKTFRMIMFLILYTNLIIFLFLFLIGVNSFIILIDLVVVGVIFLYLSVLKIVERKKYIITKNEFLKILKIRYKSIYLVIFGLIFLVLFYIFNEFDLIIIPIIMISAIFCIYIEKFES